MARRSFRDRFWSPPVARAVTAPSSILLAGAAAAIGIVATAPLSLPLGVAAAVAAGGAAYGGRVLAAVPRNTSPTDDIDPSEVDEPWRHFVIDALDARRRFDDTIGSTASGPLLARLRTIADRLDDGVLETWRIARRGNTLSRARARIDTAPLEEELTEVEGRRTSDDDPRLVKVEESVRAQLATAARMDGVIADAQTRLRLLDARFDEAVTRAIELSTGTGPGIHAATVGGDVDGIVTEMEDLRVALEEVSTSTAGSL